MEYNDASFLGGRMLDCSQIELLLDDYVDGEIDPALRVQFEHHLGCCDACNTLVCDCQRLVEVARTLANQPVPAAVSRRLRQRLAEETGYAFGSGLRVVDKDSE